MKRVINTIQRLLIISSIAFICIMPGCKNVIDSQESAKELKIESDGAIRKTPSPINPSNISHIMGIYDNKLYYFVLNENEVTYYCATEDGKQIVIENRNDYLISSGYLAYKEPNIYFFLGIQQENATSIGENLLVSYNTDTNCAEEFFCDEAETVPVMDWSVCGDNIVSRGEMVRDGEVFSYINLFNTKTGKWNKLKKSSMDGLTYIGKAWQAVSSDGENIWGLFEEREETDKTRTFLIKLNDCGEEILSIELDDDTKNYLMSSFITDMVAFQDYIYLRNASSYAILLKNEGNDLREIYRGERFCIARSLDGSIPLFFTRRSNSIYRIADGDVLEEIEIKISNERKIRTMYSSENSCYVDCRGEDDIFAYTFNRDDLEHLTLEE